NIHFYILSALLGHSIFQSQSLARFSRSLHIPNNNFLFQTAKMRFQQAFALAAGIAGAAATTCNDNCYKAVACDQKNSLYSSRKADCSSYNKVTVTPACSTVKKTVTITTTPCRITPLTTTGTTTITVATSTSTFITSILNMDFEKRDNAENLAKREVLDERGYFWSGPTYASAACASNAAYYSSACSCWGIAPQTVTAAAPTTTITVTATVTPTTTIAAFKTVTISATARATTTSTVAVQCNIDSIWALTTTSNSLSGPNGCGCSYKHFTCYQPILTGLIYTNTTAANPTACATLADISPLTMTFAYNPTTHQCILINSPNPPVVLSNSWDFGFRFTDPACLKTACIPSLLPAGLF
ncbi:hypothetical protein GQ53DRAFT_880079, partial [Thozetella sp. PMI_491]